MKRGKKVREKEKQRDQMESDERRRTTGDREDKNRIQEITKV